MIRELTNVSNETIILTDFSGMSIAPAATIDGLVFGEPALRASNDIASGILAGSLTLFDGTNTFTGLNAMDIIRYGQVVSGLLGGRPIVVSTDRPDGTYRYFTGQADDVAGNTRGTGPGYLFDVAPGETDSIECHYIDEYWLKDGVMMFQNAELGSNMSAELVCPANIPFPIPSRTGNLDRLPDGSFAANVTNTGHWMSVPIEVILGRFVNRMMVLGTGKVDIFVPEPQLIPTVYFIRLTVHNASTTVNLKACITKGTYRKTTS